MFEETRNQPEEKKRPVRIAMQGIGAFLLVLGLICLGAADQAAEILGDSETAYIFGGAMIFVAIQDLVLAHLMFGKNKDADDEDLLK